MNPTQHDPLHELETSTQHSAFSTGRVLVLLCFAALFSYYNALSGAYVMDDMRITSDANIGNPLKSDMFPRPVIALTLAMNYWLDGFNSRFYHLGNILVHILAALTLFDLLRRTFQRPRFSEWMQQNARGIAFTCAMIWFVHPLNTQSVTYIIQRCESMAGMFFLMAVWCYVRGAESDRHRQKWFAASLLMNIFGTGSKELMMALPPFLLLYDLAFLSGTWRAALKRWPVYALHLIPPMVQLYLVLGTSYAKSNTTIGFEVTLFTPKTYALTQTEVIFHYLRLAFWPSNLTLDYLDWPARQSLREVWPFALGLVALLLITAYGVIRNRVWAVPAAGFFFYLAPTSSLLPIQDAAFEHRMYLPLISVVLLTLGLGVVVLRFIETRVPRYRVSARRCAIGAMILLTGALAFRTVVRNGDYASAMQLYTQNIQSRPNNARALAVYAAHLNAAGQHDEAVEIFELAIAQPRLIWTTQLDHLQLLYSLGRLDESLVLVESMQRQKPDEELVNHLLGMHYLVLNRGTEAAIYFERASSRKPENLHYRFALSLALDQAGNTSEAKAIWNEIRKADPNFFPSRAADVRGSALEPKIIERFIPLQIQIGSAVLTALGGNDLAALDALSLILARGKRFDEAAQLAERAVEVACAAERDPHMVAMIRERVKLFKSKKPYLPLPLEQFRQGKP